MFTRLRLLDSGARIKAGVTWTKIGVQSHSSAKAFRSLHRTPRPLADKASATTPAPSFEPETTVHTIPKQTSSELQQPRDTQPQETSALPTTTTLKDAPDDEGGGERQGRGRKLGRPVGAKSGRMLSKLKEIPRPVLPSWFYENSVFLRDKHNLLEQNLLEIVKSKGTDAGSFVEVTGGVSANSRADNAVGTAKCEGRTSVGNASAKETMEVTPGQPKYYLDAAVWDELTAQLSTALIIPKPLYSDSMENSKVHFILHCPKEGTVYFTDSIVRCLGQEFDADIVRIDAQDLGEIAGDYLEETHQYDSSTFSIYPVRSLGYDAQLANQNMKDEGEEESNQENDSYLDEDESSSSYQPPPLVKPVFMAAKQNQVQELISALFMQKTTPSGVTAEETLAEATERANEKKVEMVLKELLEAPSLKRAWLKKTEAGSPDNGLGSKGNTIVHVRDYLEIERTNVGSAILGLLQSIVQRKRKSGEPIIIVGTTSTEVHGEGNMADVEVLQTDPRGSLERTIIIPATTEDGDDSVYNDDKAARFREINVRHIQDVVRRRSGSVELSVDIEGVLTFVSTSKEVPVADLNDSVWNFDRIHRIATTAIGLYIRSKRTDGKIRFQDISAAANLIQRSDEVKGDWCYMEDAVRKALEEDSSESTEDKINRISKDLDPYEKRLILGLAKPENINVNFDSVCASQDTIDTLQTLTSMALVRPDAFKYGVLASNRIPGVLLYGPPGTGKTLLARAVAKESGAAFLEVSGSEVLDKYVGEGEKNVRAIFTLAKKLSPCVVFIDEADSIFASRSSLGSKNVHREILNQFLKEWADLQSTAFLMVATNRPFDLDEAVLRRLPRRILLDLPTEAERRKILELHLSSELLAEDVSLAYIACSTPYFSGSDLKNLCVAAALNCVREENLLHKTQSIPFPEKRTLRREHFDKALEVMSASIADDMSSLKAIRKFDEKYGESRGKKKATKVWGFGVQPVTIPSGLEGRVRNI